jgi:hypothetical protein
VFESLALPGARAEAAAALAAGGEAALPVLEAAFEDPQTPAEVLARCARVCGRIGGARGRAALQARLEHPDTRVRTQVLAALAHCDFRAEPAEAARVQQAIRAEARQAAALLAALDDVGEAGALGRALLYQIDQARWRVMLLLSFVYDARAVLQTWHNLASPAMDKRAYALEMLDLMLSQDLKAAVFPVLEAPRASPAQRLGARARLAIILAEPDTFTPWVKACAVQALGEALNGEARAALAPALAATDPLVRETAAWALRRLEAGGEGEPRMLSTLEKVLILKTVSLFAQTPDEVLVEVTGLLREQECRPGEQIVAKGETGRSLYIVVEGRVRVHDGDRTLNELGEGAIFGELAVLDDAPRSATVTALEETRLFRLEQDALYELMADRPEVARGIILVLSAHLRARVQDLDALHTRLERLEGREVGGGR